MFMAENNRLAILDTDFVSKANIIRSGSRTLADEVLSFPGYQFFCHDKMKEELDNHATRPAQEWLQQKISEKRIICLTDEQILTKMKMQIGEFCFTYYRSFLKRGCELFNSNIYDQYFNAIDQLLASGKCNENSFLCVLAQCEEKIGHQQSYGEIKAFVIAQVFKLIYHADICVFCSDDYDARQGFANGDQIPCISILSVFLKMKLLGLKYDIVNSYYTSFSDWCTNRANPQTHVKVWGFSEGSMRRLRVPVETLLTDIYEGQYEARKDGDLQFLQHAGKTV